jgi:hypothetical protein
MRRVLSILMVLSVVAFAASSWSVCPQEPNDSGECDTLHIEPWDPDIQQLREAAGGPYLVRVLLRVTCDIVVDTVDSIAAFVLPLCYEKKTNLSKYCRVPADSNTFDLYPFPPEYLERSIFRHMGTAPEDSNWMMQLSEDLVGGRAWDTIVRDCDDTSHWWVTMFPTGSQDQRFWSGYRILLATMTFVLEDTMTVCIDTCFWPPNSRVSYVGDTGIGKIPRPGTGTGSFEMCFGPSVSYVREIGDFEEGRPSEFSLSQNYPNPFNPYTNFRFTLAKSAHVKIEIFNIVGQRVRTLVDEDMKAGVYLADWDGKDEKGNAVSSGIYFYRMQAGDFSDMKKMLLVK